MGERRAARVRPRSAVTAAIEEFERAYAFGVVADISEGGVCICTDCVFPIGETLTVQLSFRGQEQPVPLECYVIWCGSDAGDTYRYGLQWVHPAGSQLRRLIRDC
jgi:Tfp pilus assembly protein PilZ